MKYFILAMLVSSLCFASPKTKQATSCSVIDFHGVRPLANGVHPFWAQEVIGADLAVDSLKEVVDIEPVRLGFEGRDVDFTELMGPTNSPELALHGTARSAQGDGTRLLNLINGSAPWGVSPQAVLVAISLPENETQFRGLGRVMLDARAQLVYYMSGAAKSDETTQMLTEMASRSVVVARAGGYFPNPAPLDPNLTEGNAIVVGNLSSSGLLDSRTQEGAAVSVLAPAGEILLTRLKSGAFDQFSAGGEAATAMVTGALANAMSILGPITNAEAMYLIAKTVTPTVHTQMRRGRNGAGLINAFRMVEVAKRLLVGGWPMQRERLQDELVFDFASESRAALAEGVALLKSTSCEAQAKGFAFIRKSYLLHPSDQALNILITKYADAKLPETSDLYSSFRKKGLYSVIEKHIHESGHTSGASALRSISALGALGVPLALEAMKSEDPAFRERAEKVLSEIR